jgi:hypothetical protein
MISGAAPANGRTALLSAAPRIAHQALGCKPVGASGIVGNGDGGRAQGNNSWDPASPFLTMLAGGSPRRIWRWSIALLLPSNPL